MRVKIDRDRDGWYYVAEGLRSTATLISYDDAIRQAVADGHEHDNAGWKQKLHSWNFNNVALDGYPGWEIENPEADKYGRHPAFVKLTHARGAGDVESSALANKWDDIAAVQFYQRDWTDDGIPFVNEGETYWSGWWFKTLAERDRFVTWQRSQP